MSDPTNAAPGAGTESETGKRSGGPVLITGGAGFVGCNLADALLRDGARVRAFDNLSRPGVERNLRWLEHEHRGAVEFVEADVRDAAAVRAAVRGCSRAYHFAAQVAVTTSLTGPVADFETNARGTLNVLEAVRSEAGAGNRIPLLFTSTNKVYGDLGGVETVPRDGRHGPADAELAARGVGEDRPLDFHSPYGCSKGAADQYVLDYARSYRLPACVFRMSCVYGPRQFGTEDQGWVAHFARAVLRGEGLTFYGDGRQVRDVLHVSDLVRALRAALDEPAKTAGRAFNVGGGPANAVSLREVVAELGDLAGRDVPVATDRWRTGDQRWYVSDATALEETLGWTPRVGWRTGLADLASWLGEHVETAGPAPVPADAAAPALAVA